jgi:signal peptidase
MKLFSKIYGESVYILTVAVLLSAMIFTVPRFFRITPYIVLSGSMEPLIQTGSVAFIDHNRVSPAVGDIITYDIGDSSPVLVTHRVVKKNTDGSLIMKGDANEAPDISAVTHDQIIGTYVASIPKAGYLLSKVSRIEIYILIGLIILLNISSRLLDVIMEENEEDAESQ